MSLGFANLTRPRAAVVAFTAPGTAPLPRIHVTLRVLVTCLAFAQRYKRQQQQHGEGYVSHSAVLSITLSTAKRSRTGHGLTVSCVIRGKQMSR
mmetsp:Transcript_39174/g.47430  ORF Transcript_39174/g.47430 Transcript_39174/m.47430 type:complete len:94 (-) Transcript_39174:79-360(-)